MPKVDGPRLRLRYSCGHTVAVTMKIPDNERQWRTEQVANLLTTIARHKLCKECRALPAITVTAEPEEMASPYSAVGTQDIPTAPEGYKNNIVNGVNMMTCKDCGSFATARGKSWPVETQVMHEYSCSFKYDSTMYDARAVEANRGWWYTECKLCGGTSGKYQGGKPIPYAVYHRGNCRLHVPLSRVWRPSKYPGLRITKESFTGNPSGVIQCEECQASRYIQHGSAVKVGAVIHKPDCRVGNKLLSEVEKLLHF